MGELEELRSVWTSEGMGMLRRSNELFFFFFFKGRCNVDKYINILSLVYYTLISCLCVLIFVVYDYNHLLFMIILLICCLK